MEYWIWLRLIKGLGPIIEKRLLNRFETPRSIYQASIEELMTVEGIGKVLANNINSSRSLEQAYSILEDSYKKDIKLLTYNDPLYPGIAKEYPGAPTLLYYRGTIRNNIEGVAIVGSRRCSEYGKQIAVEAAEFLAETNIPVISGMAKGIDGYAHTACIKNAGYPIAFLGTGVDICYPSEHIKLMEAVINNGAVISEYPPGTRARTESFPRRNGLISSWSSKILVVEAAEKSGALITADLGKSQGREIFAPPHEIYKSTGKGSNRLILEGANIYLYPSQLINKVEGTLREEINLTDPISFKAVKKRKPTEKKEKLLPIEEKIISCITYNPKTIEDIGKAIDINQVDLIQHISIMELEGRIKEVVGGKYIIS